MGAVNMNKRKNIMKRKDKENRKKKPRRKNNKIRMVYLRRSDRLKALGGGLRANI